MKRLLVKLSLHASTVYTSSQVNFPICPWARWVLAADTFCSTSGHSPLLFLWRKASAHSQSDLQEPCPLHQDLDGQGTEAGAPTYSTHWQWMGTEGSYCQRKSVFRVGELCDSHPASTQRTCLNRGDHRKEIWAVETEVKHISRPLHLAKTEICMPINILVIQTIYFLSFFF